LNESVSGPARGHFLYASKIKETANGAGAALAAKRGNDRSRRSKGRRENGEIDQQKQLREFADETQKLPTKSAKPNRALLVIDDVVKDHPIFGRLTVCVSRSF
jgi:hypothetical protein